MLFKRFRKAKSPAKPKNEPDLCGAEVRTRPRLIREESLDGRRLRLYSDGSIEAATPRGWMFFGDIDEYEAYSRWRHLRAVRMNRARQVRLRRLTA